MDDHGEAGGGDLAADSEEVSRREVTRAPPHAEEGMKDGDFPNAVDGKEGELVDPVNLPMDKVPQGIEDGKSHSGHGASCGIRVGAGCPSARVFEGGVRDQ